MKNSSCRHFHEVAITLFHSIYTADPSTTKAGTEQVYLHVDFFNNYYSTTQSILSIWNHPDEGLVVKLLVDFGCAEDGRP